MTSVKKVVYSGVFVALHCFSFSAGAAVVPKNAETDLQSLKSLSNSSESLRPAGSAPASPSSPRMRKTPSMGSLGALFSPKGSKSKESLTSPSSGSLARPFSMGSGTFLHTSVDEGNEEEATSSLPASPRRRSSESTLQSMHASTSGLGAAARPSLLRQDTQGSTSSLGNLEGNTFENLEALNQTAQQDVLNAGQGAEDAVSQTSSLSTISTMDEETIKKINIYLKKAFAKEDGWSSPHAVYLHSVEQMIKAVVDETNIQSQLTTVLEKFEEGIAASKQGQQKLINKRKAILTDLSKKYGDFLKKDKKELAKRLKKLKKKGENAESDSLSITEAEHEAALAHLQNSLDYYMDFLDDLGQEGERLLERDSTYYRTKLRQIASYTLVNHYATLIKGLESLSPEELNGKTTQQIRALAKDARAQRRAAENVEGKKKSLLGKLGSAFTSGKKKLEDQLKNSNTQLAETAEKLKLEAEAFFDTLISNSEEESLVIKEHVDYEFANMLFFLQNSEEYLPFFDPSWESIQPQITKSLKRGTTQLERLRDAPITPEHLGEIKKAVKEVANLTENDSWVKATESVLESQWGTAVTDLPMALDFVKTYLGKKMSNALAQSVEDLKGAGTNFDEALTRGEGRRKALEEYTAFSKHAMKETGDVLQYFNTVMLPDSDTARCLGALLTIQRSPMVQTFQDIQIWMEKLKDSTDKQDEGIKEELAKTLKETFLPEVRDLYSEQIQQFADYGKILVRERKRVEELNWDKQRVDEIKDQIDNVISITNRLLQQLLTETESSEFQALLAMGDEKEKLDFQEMTTVLHTELTEIDIKNLEYCVADLKEMGFETTTPETYTELQKFVQAKTPVDLRTDSLIAEIDAIDLKEIPQSFFEKPLDFNVYKNASEKFSGKKISRRQQKSLRMVEEFQNQLHHVFEGIFNTLNKKA